VYFVRFIDTGVRKFVKDKHVQNANIVWNVLHLCLRLLQGTVTTKQMCGMKSVHQVLWHSSAKLCTNNYENLSIFVKVAAKKSVAPFSCWHGVHYNSTSVFDDCTRLYLRFHGVTFHLQCLGCGVSTGPLISSKVCLSGNHLVAPLHIQHRRLTLGRIIM